MALTIYANQLQSTPLLSGSSSWFSTNHNLVYVIFIIDIKKSWKCHIIMSLIDTGNILIMCEECLLLRGNCMVS